MLHFLCKIQIFAITVDSSGETMEVGSKTIKSALNETQGDLLLREL